MAGPDSEPKHPYVTCQNAKVHLMYSISIGIMSVVQIILGIIINEMELKEMVGRFTDTADGRRYYSSYDLDSWFLGDHVWVGCAGIILAILGYSVYRTRSRANGIILSVMCFFSGFIIYPVAVGLGGGMHVSSLHFVEGITGLRVGSAVYTGAQAIVVLTWAFYSALHACCNSKVRTQTRLNIQPPGASVAPQPQVVYVSQPGQYPGGQPVQYIGGQPGQQPVQYIGGQPGQQPVYIQGPPQYVQQAQVPVQVQHGGPPPQRQVQSYDNYQYEHDT